MRVESVNSYWRHTALTRGWAHLTVFSNADYAPKAGDVRLLMDSGSISQLLARCSAFIDYVHLVACGRLDDVGLLDRCRRVQEVYLCLEHIDTSLVDYLREWAKKNSGTAPLRYVGYPTFIF